METLETLRHAFLLKSLIKSQCKLVDSLEPDNFQDDLKANNLLTSIEFENVLAERSRHSKVQKILSYVEKKDAEMILKFLKVIRKKDSFKSESETIVLRACLYQCEEDIMQQTSKHESMIKDYVQLGRFPYWQCGKLTRHGKLERRLRKLIKSAAEKRKHFFLFLEMLKNMQLTALEARLFELCPLDEYDAVDDGEVKNTSLILTTTLIVTSVRDEPPRASYVKKIMNLYFMRDSFDLAFKEAIELGHARHGSIRKVYRREHNITVVRVWYESEKSLQHVFDYTQGPFSEDVVKEWIQMIAEALNRLHMTSTYHGNLKPSNIFRNGDSIEFVDFAIKEAFLKPFTTRSKSSSKRLKYIAPEVKERAKIGTSSDIWSLGAIAYDMLIRQHGSEQRDLSLIQSNLLRSLLGRMLLDGPNERPTATGIGEILLSGLFISVVVTCVDDVQIDPESAGVAELKRSTGFKQASRDAALLSVGEPRSRRNSTQNAETSKQLEIDLRIAEFTNLLQMNKQCKSDNWKVLHVVCQKGCDDEDVLRRLRGEVNAKSIHYETPLHIACKHGHTNVVQFLIQNGAVVSLRNDTGQTGLHFAAAGGFREIVAILLKSNANLTNYQNNDWETALHVAAGQGHVEVVKLLMKRPATIDLTTRKKETALHFAARSGHPDICELLLRKNANPENKTRSGYTALYFACVHGCSEAVKVIAKYADINEKIFKGMTPLHLAAEHNFEAVVKCLLDPPPPRIANVDAQDRKGKTPLHIACDKGYMSIVRLLLSKSPDLTLRDKNNKTANEVAIKLEIRQEIKKQRGRKM